jgi:hypothetical protein
MALPNSPFPAPYPFIKPSPLSTSIADILNDAVVSDFDKGGKYQCNRYINTQKGSVDLKHVRAAGTPFSSGTILPITVVWETMQAVTGYRKSAFADEDLRSNAIGAAASDASWPEGISGKTFGDEAARLINKMGVIPCPK